MGNARGNFVQAATAFTTGSSAGGYTLRAATAKFWFRTKTSPGDLVVAIHAASGGSPASDAIAILSGNNPGTLGGDYTYTCSTGCNLLPNTIYFLVMSARNADFSGHYAWSVTGSDGQTNEPGDAGWQISNVLKSKFGGGTWTDHSHSGTGMFKVTATVNEIDDDAPSVRYKPPSSLTVGQRIRAIVPITSDTDIASYALKDGSVLPRGLRLDEKTGMITGRPATGIGRVTVVTVVVCDGAKPTANCDEVTLKLPAIIDEEADAPPPEPQLPEVPPLDLSSVKVGDAAPSSGLLLALASAGAALVAGGVGVAVRRRGAPSRRRRRT